MAELAFRCLAEHRCHQDPVRHLSDMTSFAGPREVREGDFWQSCAVHPKADEGRLPIVEHGHGSVAAHRHRTWHREFARTLSFAANSAHKATIGREDGNLIALRVEDVHLPAPVASA